MRRTRGDGIAVLAVFCLLMVLPAGVTRVSAADTADVAGEHGTVTVIQVRGPTDHADHPVQVWRPPGPDSATIPVLYFLHGYPGAAADPFGNGITRILDHRLEQGYPPFVFASVDGNGERFSDTEFADSWDNTEDVMARVTDAAIPAVEGTHMRDAGHRAIAGFSMGGYGAMNIAMQNPGVFGQEDSIAGYYVVNDLSGMFGNRPAVIRLNTPSAHPAWARGMRVLLNEDAGDQLTLVSGQAQWMGGLLRQAHVPVTVRIEPGTHDWAYALTALQDSFGYLDTGWRDAAIQQGFSWP